MKLRPISAYVSLCRPPDYAGVQPQCCGAGGERGVGIGIIPVI